MSDMWTLSTNLSPVWARPWELFVDHARGAFVWDRDGNKYLDFTSGISVTNTGHCHPRVVEAVKAQADKLLHAQANMFYHGPMLKLVKQLRRVVPSGLDTFFFANSGSEAVEGAIKLARHATGRTNIIAFERSFHGRSVGAMSVTSVRTSYRVGYQPLMPGVFFAPYAYCYRCPVANASSGKYGHENCCEWPLDQLRFILKSQTAPEETAAVLVEPILGQGGFVVPSKGFLRGLRDICDEYGILLIIDEVHTGFGRTGRFFAMEHFDVVPDVLVMGKAIASGLPLSAIAAPKALMDKWVVGSHGGTFSGNIVACAAGDATIRVLLEEKLVENAQRAGEKLIQQLYDVQNRNPAIGDVRGLGLMVATEIVKPGSLQPDGSLAKAIQKGCFEKKLLLATCSTYENIIRWMPPLNVGDAEIDAAVTTFNDVLGELLA